MNISTLTIYNPWFYVVVAVLMFTGWLGIKRLFRGIPILKNKSYVYLICIIGFLLVGGASYLGISSNWGTASLTSVSAMRITNIQITGLSPSAAGGTTTLDANNPYLIHVRQTDAQANETSIIYELNSSKFTITRSGDLKAASCLVKIYSADWLIDETTGQQGSTPFNILEKDATGRYKSYLADSTTWATTSDSQGEVQVAFAEGVATKTFTMLMNVEETAHDALNQYSSRDVTLDVCGTPVIVKFTRMD